MKPKALCTVALAMAIHTIACFSPALAGFRHGGKAPQGVAPYTERHALVVGVSRYEGVADLTSLSGPPRDATAVANVLKTRFGFENVTLVLDRQPPATIATGIDLVRARRIDASVIRASIEAIDAGPRDALVFFYAGHGYPGSLALDRLHKAAGVRYDYADLVPALAGLSAHDTLIVLDCCFGGTVANGTSLRPVLPLTPRRSRLFGGESGTLGNLFRRPSLQILTAGATVEGVHDQLREGEISRRYAGLTPVRGNSPFTAALLKGLKGATGRSDGTLLASSLGYFVTNTFVNEPDWKIRQTPQHRLVAGEGDMVLVPIPPVLPPTVVAPLYSVGPERELIQFRIAALSTLVPTARALLAKPPSQDSQARLAAWTSLGSDVAHHLNYALGSEIDGVRRSAARAAAALVRLATRKYGSSSRERLRVVFGPLRTGVIEVISRELPISNGKALPDQTLIDVGAVLGYLAQLDLLKESELRLFATHVRELQESWNSKVKGVVQLPPFVRHELPDSCWSVPDSAQELRLQIGKLEAVRRIYTEKLFPRLKEVYEYGDRLATAERVALEGDRSLRAGSPGRAHKQYLEAIERFQDLATPARHPELGAWAACLSGSRPLLGFRAHQGQVHSVAVTQDASEIASGGEDRKTHLWALPSGEKIQAWDHPGPVVSVGFLGSRVVTGCADGVVRVWDRGATSPVLSCTTSQEGALTALSVAETGDCAAGYQSGKLVVWSLLDGSRKAEIQVSGSKPVHSVTISADGDLVAAASSEAGLRIWSTTSAKAVGEVPRSDSSFAMGSALSMAFSPDCTQLVIGTTGGRILSCRIEEIISGDSVVSAFPDSFSAPLATPVIAVGYSGNNFAGITESGAQCVLDPNNPFSFDHDSRVTPGWESATCAAIAARRRLFVAGSADGIIRLVQLRGELPPSGVRVIETPVDYFEPTPFASSHNGYLGATISGRLRLWDLATGCELGGMRGVLEADSVAFSTCDRFVVTAGETLSLWSVETGLLLQRVPRQLHAQFVSNTNLLVSLDHEGRVRTWELKGNRLYPTGTSKGRHERARRLQLVVTDDVKIAITATYSGDTKMWDVVTLAQHPLQRDRLRAQSRGLRVSADGSRVFQSNGGGISLWSPSVVNSRKLSLPSRPMSDFLTPDGDWLVSATSGQHIELWEVAQRRSAVSFRVPTGDLIHGGGGEATAIGAATGRLGSFPVSFHAGPNILRLWTRSSFDTQVAPQPPKGSDSPLARGRALASLGEWFAEHGLLDWGSHLSREASLLGAPVSPLSLGRLLWRAGRFAEAAVQFEKASASKLADSAYLDLCLSTLRKLAHSSTRLVVPAHGVELSVGIEFGHSSELTIEAMVPTSSSAELNMSLAIPGSGSLVALPTSTHDGQGQSKIRLRSNLPPGCHTLTLTSDQSLIVDLKATTRTSVNEVGGPHFKDAGRLVPVSTSQAESYAVVGVPLDISLHVPTRGPLSFSLKGEDVFRARLSVLSANGARWSVALNEWTLQTFEPGVHRLRVEGAAGTLQLAVTALQSAGGESIRLTAPRRPPVKVASLELAKRSSIDLIVTKQSDLRLVARSLSLRLLEGALLIGPESLTRLDVAPGQQFVKTIELSPGRYRLELRGKGSARVELFDSKRASELPSAAWAKGSILQHARTEMTGSVMVAVRREGPFRLYFSDPELRHFRLRHSSRDKGLWLREGWSEWLLLAPGNHELSLPPGYVSGPRAVELRIYYVPTDEATPPIMMRD